MTVMVCAPTSCAFGIQLKPPPALIEEDVRLEVVRESPRENVGFGKLVAAALKKTVCPTVTTVPGESETMETVGIPCTVICCVALAVLPF